MYCSKCGKEIKDGSAYCNYCGAKLNDDINININSKKIINDSKNSLEKFIDTLKTNYFYKETNDKNLVSTIVIVNIVRLFLNVFPVLLISIFINFNLIFIVLILNILTLFSIYCELKYLKTFDTRYMDTAFKVSCVDYGLVIIGGLSVIIIAIFGAFMIYLTYIARKNAEDKLNSLL